MTVPGRTFPLVTYSNISEAHSPLDVWKGHPFASTGMANRNYVLAVDLLQPEFNLRAANKAGFYDVHLFPPHYMMNCEIIVFNG